MYWKKRSRYSNIGSSSVDHFVTNGQTYPRKPLLDGHQERVFNSEASIDPVGTTDTQESSYDGQRRMHIIMKKDKIAEESEDEFPSLTESDDEAYDRTSRKWRARDGPKDQRAEENDTWTPWSWSLCKYRKRNSQQLRDASRQTNVNHRDLTLAQRKMTEPCDICMKFGHWKRECPIRQEVYQKLIMKTYCKAFMKSFNSSEDEMTTNPSYPGGAHGNPFYDGEDGDPKGKRTMTAHRRRLWEKQIEQAYLVNRLTGEEKRR